MKNKKLIVWAALAVFAVGLLITVIIMGSTGKKPENEITASTEPESTVHVSDITVDDPTQSGTVTEPVIEPEDPTEETETGTPLTLEDEPLPPVRRRHPARKPILLTIPSQVIHPETTDRETPIL